MIDNIEAIAQRWIRIFSTPAEQRPPDLVEDDSWWELPMDNPELCYSVILQVLRTVQADPSDPVIQLLAAGPLEDLLANHGAVFIERIETEARRSPAFNLLLGGVWKSSISDDVWARVQAARIQTW